MPSTTEICFSTENVSRFSVCLEVKNLSQMNWRVFITVLEVILLQNNQSLWNFTCGVVRQLLYHKCGTFFCFIKQKKP